MNAFNKCTTSRGLRLLTWPKSHNMLLRNTSKIAVEVDDAVLSKLETNEIKTRQHPGIVKATQISLPKNITTALERVIGDFPIKPLLKDCQKLNQYISARHPPPEQHDLQEKLRTIMEEVDKKYPKEQIKQLDEDGIANWRKKRDTLIRKRLAERNYAWKPITYGKYEALVYGIGRGAQEYAVLMRILKELQMRDTDFKPRSFFDFGSGVGTAMWAASALWKEHIFEYYNVDVSRDMNELSELVLREGNDNQQMTLQNVYYRQFLPGIHTKYDLVISAYTLFELPSAEARRDVLLNLWRKCDRYLVIVEEGTRRGSELVNEARSLLLKQKHEDLKAHVVAPCAHDLRCPRMADKEDTTPCNFELAYQAMPISDLKSQNFSTRYSYVVLKKGMPTDETRCWPRLVRPTLVRSRHAICRMCTAEGKLQEVIFTPAKHGKVAYRCAKSSRWGDRLPIALGDFMETKETKTQKIMEQRRKSVEVDDEQQAGDEKGDDVKLL